MLERESLEPGRGGLSQEDEAEALEIRWAPGMGSGD
jgi:hypothetical protein